MEDPKFVTPDGNALRIWKEPVKNPAASERAGRPLFDEVTYVEVISPGSPGSSPVFELERVFNTETGLPPVRSHHYEKYAGQVEAFQRNEFNADMTGTALTEWPEISRTMAASLNAQGVYTVEALSNLPDNRLGVVGPDGRTWRTKAAAWLENVKDSGAATRYAAELQREREVSAQLRADLERLSATVAALTNDHASPGSTAGPVSAPLAAPEAPAAPQPPASLETPSVDPLAPAAAPGDSLVAAPASLGAII